MDTVTVLQVTVQGKKRLLGVKEASAQLGVTRQHFYLVVHGKRRSPRIERWLKQNMRRAA